MLPSVGDLIDLAGMVSISPRDSIFLFNSTPGGDFKPFLLHAFTHSLIDKDYVGTSSEPAVFLWVGT